ncbi:MULTISPECIES: HAMP domain-containing sensor histidine kinase [unclassified Streptomyces]|uniref:sensor histidine kinase n=1 Tax=unclassified Streptomyces TaxID=2593676 RepID=UPI00225C1CF7|nr:MULTISPECIES: HAMP domain-containing sensor histidine kinase [unclassified Streptomyces]MCX4882281.1 HAMP domain-containing histidine kinase [Streptomyces sp. NBC_00847]MCX5422323.1 HAMP domain-containing histidine kinase [Streptomyces sp. NBC_00078]
MRRPAMRRPALHVGAKVALAVAAAAMCVAGTIGVLVHRTTAADQLATARSGLDQELLSAAGARTDGRRSDARLDPPDLPGPVARAVRDDVRVTYLQEGGKEPVLWAATRISDRKVLAIRRTYAPEEKSLATLDRTLFATGAGVTVLVSLAGLVLGVRMGRRATAAAHTAERIADGDLDARVRPRGHDEIARLAASVDTMADALGARLEAERRVTADIAHELRTPVAGMSAAVGLLPPGRASDLVAGSVQKLRGLVEDVLEVARLDSHAAAVETEEREVSAMTRRAVAGLDDVSVKVAADVVVATDPRRVERILANLAANALRHGAPPVEMEVDGPVVRVRDHGPGFPPELLSVLHTSGPQRFRTGSPTGGTGLGLTIATGQARLLGARLTFRNRPEGGAETELWLPTD